MQFEGHAPTEKVPSKVPDPPEGCGPVLAYQREAKWAVWASAPVPIVLLLAVFVWDSGWQALTFWFTWVLLGAYFAWMVYKGRSDVVTAGADWVRFNGRWVRTYELVRIKYSSYGMGGVRLLLKDEDGLVDVPLPVLQANKELWNFVYLGMRYSAANGAELNRTARAQFPELAPR